MIALLLAALVAHAAPRGPKFVPALDDLRIFTSVDRPRLHLLCGRVHEGKRAGEPFVVEVERDRVDVPRVRAVAGADADALSLTYPDGSWLFVPAHGAGASIVHPAREREMLTEVKPDAVLMEALGARVSIGHPFTLAASPAATPAPGPVAGTRLVRFKFKDAEGARRLIEAHPNLVTWHTNGDDESPGVVAWAFAEDAPSILESATEVPLEVVRHDELSASDLPAPPTGLVPPPARDLWRYLDRLRISHQNLLSVGYALAYYRNADPAKRAFERDFVAPLMHRIGEGFESLRGLDTDLGRELYLFAGGPVGPRLSQLDWSAGTGRGAFFAEWLAQLARRTDYVGPHHNVEAQCFVRGGPVLPHFPDNSVYYVDLLPAGTCAYLEDDLPTYPLRVFGLEDSPRRRAALIRFLLSADKSAEWQRRNVEIPMPIEGARGNQTLARVVRALPFGVADHRIDPGFPAVRFRSALYFTQVAQILTEVLNTSHVTITNYATYLTLLDAGLTLQGEIARDFGDNPSAGGHSLERDRLTTETFRLHRAVQTQTVRICNVALAGRLR